MLALAAQGVQIGDDIHMRTQGTTSLLIRNLLPQLVALPDARRVELARFLSGNHLFFLNLAMAAARSLTMSAEQVPGSSIVTTMCRNGTTFGIRLAGDDTLFISDAPPVEDAMYYPDYGPETPLPTSATAPSSNWSGSAPRLRQDRRRWPASSAAGYPTRLP